MSLIRPFFVRLTCALLTGLCLLGWVVPPVQAADQTEAAASQTDPDVYWAASALLDHSAAAGLVAFHSVTPLSAAWLYSVEHYGWLRGLMLVSQTAAPQELGLPVVPTGIPTANKATITMWRGWSATTFITKALTE